MGHILTDQNFKEKIATGVALVDFWAEWCTPCRIQGPIVEDIAKQYEGNATVTIAKLNVDENPIISQEFGIMSIPTIMIFKDGSQVDQLIGLQTKESLLKRLKDHTG